MRFSISALSSLSTLSLLSQCLAAAPTWPASTDEIEDIMFLTAGYRSRAFADLVTPCSKSPNMPGRINAAEWIRSGFHDMATADVTSGVVVGGLDASLMFETGRSENSGPAFTTTFIFLQQYFSVRASIADLLALSMYTAVRACGGPVVPVRGGRIDATAAGALGVPMPENPTLTFVAQFARMGFNRSEMIDATACGHTIGGVHSAQNPLIVPVGTATNEYALFDDPTQAQSTFNNKVATEFILGNTTNPLVVGISKTNGRNSDFRVFAVDGNATINSLTDPAVFARRCAIILQKIIDTVPAGVSLSAAIEPYEVKPVNPQLTLLAGGASLKFSGEIRVRTTVRAASQIASVQLVYKNRSGGAGGTIATAVVGTGTGFDDSFTFYGFSETIDSTTSISSFTVVINLVGGSSETYDNNGASYPVQDTIIFQSPQSCLDLFTNSANQRQLTVVAAKRSDAAGTPVLDLTVKTARTDGVVVPVLVPTSLPMTSSVAAGPYTLYTVSTPIGSTQSLKNSFDVTLGAVKDAFKLTANLPNSCAPFDGSSSSSSSSSVATSTSASSSSSSSSATSTSTSAAPPASTGWTSLGCYTDSVAARSLPFGTAVPGGAAAMTNALCQAACQAAGYTLAGTEYSAECYCGNALQNGGAPAPDGTAGCNMACNGASTEICGGSNRLSLYSFGAATSSSVAPTTTTSASSAATSTTASSTTSVAPQTTGWAKIGCYTDSVAARALSFGAAVPGGAAAMTNELCQAACSAAGYALAGTEYSGECYCGAAVTNGHGPAPDGETGCNMACNGASGEICGGSNRLSLYSYGGAPATGPASTTSSAAPQATGWAKTGCYTDSVAARALAFGAAVPGGAAAMTNELCQAACEAAGYVLAGTEYSGECYCGAAVANGHGPAPDGEAGCNMACNGASGEMCGGSNRLSLYSYAGAQAGTATTAGTTTTTTASVPAIKRTIGAYAYLGCQTDSVAQRVLSAAYSAGTGMTLESCAAFCDGHEYFGTEYGAECWCGTLAAESVGVADAECSMVCAGDGGEFCGAGNRLSVYRVSA